MSKTSRAGFIKAAIAGFVAPFAAGAAVAAPVSAKQPMEDRIAELEAEMRRLRAELTPRPNVPVILV